MITIDTLSRYDQPASRGTQLLAALDYLTNSSGVRTRIDRNRLAVMGHSMGGGGSLSAASTRPSLQAAIPLTGWHTTKSWSGVRVPTLVVGAENDSVAPVASHSEPFYTSLPSTLDKAYLELNNASHSAPTSSNVTIAKYSISWLKRFVDDDTRYEQFLCPAPQASTIQEYRDTCPIPDPARCPLPLPLLVIMKLLPSDSACRGNNFMINGRVGAGTGWVGWGAGCCVGRLG
ncbi:alpha/beta hydrolase [Micromonospora sp. M12]